MPRFTLPGPARCRGSHTLCTGRYHPPSGKICQVDRWRSEGFFCFLVHPSFLTDHSLPGGLILVWWVRLGRLFSPWKVRWCRPCICLLWGCPSCPEDVPWLSLLVVEHLVWVRALSNRLKMFKNSFRGCEYCILPYLQSKNLARTSQATQTAWSHFTCNFPKRLQKLCSKSVTKSWLQKNQSSMLSVFPNTDTTVWTGLNPMSGVTQVACSGGCLSHHVNSQVASLHRPLGGSRILSPGHRLTSEHSVVYLENTSRVVSSLAIYLGLRICQKSQLHHNTER